MTAGIPSWNLASTAASSAGAIRAATENDSRCKSPSCGSLKAAKIGCLLSHSLSRSGRSVAWWMPSMVPTVRPAAASGRLRSAVTFSPQKTRARRRARRTRRSCGHRSSLKSPTSESTTTSNLSRFGNGSRRPRSAAARTGWPHRARPARPAAATVSRKYVDGQQRRRGRSAVDQQHLVRRRGQDGDRGAGCPAAGRPRSRWPRPPCHSPSASGGRSKRSDSHRARLDLELLAQLELLRPAASRSTTGRSSAANGPPL